MKPRASNVVFIRHLTESLIGITISSDKMSYGVRMGAVIYTLNLQELKEWALVPGREAIAIPSGIAVRMNVTVST